MSFDLKRKDNSYVLHKAMQAFNKDGLLFAVFLTFIHHKFSTFFLNEKAKDTSGCSIKTFSINFSIIASGS